jgi:uncharacterized protein YjbI with pentapeptide repeats
MATTTSSEPSFRPSSTVETEFVNARPFDDLHNADSQNVNLQIADCQNVDFQISDSQNVDFQISDSQNVD